MKEVKQNYQGEGAEDLPADAGDAIEPSEPKGVAGNTQLQKAANPGKDD